MNKIKIIDKEFGVFELKGQVLVGSRFVADFFEREHKTVLRTITNITSEHSGVSRDFTEHNYVPSEYKDPTGRKLPEYYLTRDGFMMLVMGFTGQKAMQIKEAYMNKFNEMEQFISSLHTARLECPALTDAILQVHDELQHYHFSNEMDMINRIVLGMTAKQYKEANGLGKVQSIRPYLDQEQIRLIEMLQKTDIGLVIAEPDFQKRKRTLEWYHTKLKERLRRKQITA